MCLCGTVACECMKWGVEGKEGVAVGVAVERQASQRSSARWLGCLADGTHHQGRWVVVWGGLRRGACGDGGWCESQSHWTQLSWPGWRWPGSALGVSGLRPVATPPAWLPVSVHGQKWEGLVGEECRWSLA